jgi:hypothetical protein
MVVAKPDHGGHGKLQHLVGWTTPNATHHGQEIPVSKRLAEFVRAQEVGEGLLQLFFALLFGNAGAQRIEAHHIQQHAPKTRVDQVAALREHAVQVGTAPLQRLAIFGPWHFD